MRPEREHLSAWRDLEHEYADAKFEDQRRIHDVRMHQDQVSEDGFWWNQIVQYVGRARVFGLDTPQVGRCWRSAG